MTGKPRAHRLSPIRLVSMFPCPIMHFMIECGTKITQLRLHCFIFLDLGKS